MQVGEVGEDWFSIYLIPETLRVTVLGTKQQGDTVNLEIEAQTQVSCRTAVSVMDWPLAEFTCAWLELILTTWSVLLYLASYMCVCGLCVVCLHFECPVLLTRGDQPAGNCRHSGKGCSAVLAAKSAGLVNIGLSSNQSRKHCGPQSITAVTKLPLVTNRQYDVLLITWPITDY